jgi:hypothetical protein
MGKIRPTGTIRNERGMSYCTRVVLLTESLSLGLGYVRTPVDSRARYRGMVYLSQ